MSISKQSDLARSNTVVSSQSAAEIAAAETKAKPKESAQSSARTQGAKPTHLNSTQVIENAAKARAQADALAIRDHAQQVYNRELALNLQELLGEDASAYFRCPIESVALPALPTAEYLRTVTVAALPSAD